MSRNRALVFSLCAWPLCFGCTSRHDFTSDDGPSDAPSDAADDGTPSDGVPDGYCDAGAPDVAPGPVAAFLGDWTLTATSHQQCSPLSLVGLYQTGVCFEPGPAAVDGGADLLFDPGLGCWLPMLVDGSVAQLAGPTLCGSPGTPPDLEFTSVQVTVTESSVDIHETMSGACEYVIEGILYR